MAGWLTDYMPIVGPAVPVGTGLPSNLLADNYPQLQGYEKAPFDTAYLNGVATNPQVFPATVAVSAFDVAAFYFVIQNSTATATSGAATLSKPCGTVTSEGLTTAAGATYTLTLTNTLVTATSNVKAVAYLKSATTGGPLIVTSIVPAAGSVVITVLNNGSTLLNGTIAIMFLVTGAV